MKKLTVLILVVTMLVVTSIPAFAAGGPPTGRGSANGSCTGNQAAGATSHPYRSGLGYRSGYGIRNPYSLSGTIISIDDGSRTITVAIECGNQLAQASVDMDVTLQTTDATRFLLRNADGTVTPITFGDLAIGQNISSHGSLVNGVWTATRVTSGALLNCLQ